MRRLWEGLRNSYVKLIDVGTAFGSLLLLAMRLFWGGSFFQTGLKKVESIPSIASYFASLGIPFAELSAYAVGYIELIAGALIVIGLASRLAAIPLICVTIGAYFFAHFDSVRNIFSDPNAFIHESPFNFMLMAMIIFAFGPGKISIDYALEKLFSRNS